MNRKVVRGDDLLKAQTPDLLDHQSPPTQGVIDNGIYLEKRLTLTPKKGENLVEQTDDILNQMREHKIDPWKVVTQNNYMGPENFEEKDAMVRDRMKGFYALSPPATSSLSQQPADNNQIAVELITVEPKTEDPKINVERRSVVDERLGETTYNVVEAEDGKWKILYAAGLTNEKTKGVKEQAEKAFLAAKKILETENMSFKDVDYQENVVSNIDGPNYKQFNSVRRKFYEADGLTNNFPAATGIGQTPIQSLNQSDRVVISLRASKGTKKVAVDNLRQTASHQYSDTFMAQEAVKVRAGQSIGSSTPQVGVGQKMPKPAFERGRATFSGDETPLTQASEKKPLTKNQWVIRTSSAVEAQTLQTLNNIAALISGENLKAFGIRANPSFDDIKQLITYIKEPNDIPAVKEIVTKLCPKSPTLFTQADICYAALVTEIRGTAQLPNGVFDISGTASVGTHDEAEKGILHNPQKYRSGDCADVTYLVKMLTPAKMREKGFNVIDNTL